MAVGDAEGSDDHGADDDVKARLFSWLIGLALCLAVLAWEPGPAEAAAGTPEAVESLDFALSLYRQGDLPRAVGELKRFLFCYPDDPRRAEVEALLHRIESERTAAESDRTGPESSGGGPAVGLVRFYQDHLRTFRGSGVCPSHPSCSEYAIQAMRTHGAVLGTFMQVDRFFREFTTAGAPPFVWRDGQKLHYDPVKANDYWWTGGRGEK